MDSDRDGIPDSEDNNPYDFDNDGMPNSWEIKNKLRYDIDDSRQDPDRDGLSNLIEYQLGTDPHTADNTKELKIKKSFNEELPARYLNSRWSFIKKVLPYIIGLIIAFILFLLRNKIKELFYRILKRERNKEDSFQERYWNYQPNKNQYNQTYNQNKNQYYLPRKPM